MTSLVRIGDVNTGHDCYPPVPIISGSFDVFVNRISSCRQGDIYQQHCCGRSCHVGVQIGASFDIFINGLPAARVGDPVSCGAAAAAGSPNVFGNDYVSF